MKKTIFISCISLLSVACANRKYATEQVSEKYVTLSMSKAIEGGNLTLNVPVEFALDLNHRNVKDVGIYWKLDNKLLADVRDYVVVNGKTDKIIYAIEDLEYPNYPARIYLMRRTNHITQEDALALLKRYQPNASLEQIKSRNDTIRLVRYSQYRKDHPDFLAEMRKQPDSLILSIGFSGGKQEVFTEKINW